MTSDTAESRSVITRLKAVIANISIAGRMRVLFGLLAALAVLISASGLLGLAFLHKSTRAYETASATAITGSQLSGSFAQAQAHAMHYLVSGDQSEFEMARKSLEETTSAIGKLREQADTGNAALSARLNGLSEAAQRLDSDLAAISSRTDRKDLADIAVDMDRLTFVGDSFYSQASTMNDDISGNLSTIGKRVMSNLTANIAVIALLGIIAIGLAMLAMRHARRSISAPLENIAGTMRQLVDGDDATTIPETERQDEIGELARGLQIFRDNAARLQELQHEVAVAAQSELARKAGQEREREEMNQQKTALLAELADKFERTIGEVASSVASASAQLKATAGDMASAASESAQHTSEVTSALISASTGVTAAASTTDEFAVSINEISRHAASSADLARNAAESASNADATISRLSESTREIGAIVQLISSIARQTDLLALNASIEAARSHETAGRGFAVVASEVKELAKRTTAATNEVAERIALIQQATGETIEALGIVGAQIAELETVSLCIASAVDQQSVAGQELARNIALAAHNTDDIASNIDQVRDASIATGAAASQLLSSSTELENQATSLKKQVNDFLSQVRAA